MPSSKKTDLKRDFAAGVYQSLQTGDTVSHVVFSTQLGELLPFQPSLWFNPPPFHV